MTARPRVHIAIPYWGKFDLLTQAVESVRAQSYQHWRLTIVDDAYPSDDAATYCRALDDARISYLRNDATLGITRNFNRCVELLDAEFGMIMGYDDKLAPEYLAQALATIGEATMYHPQVAVIDADGKQHVPLVDRVKRLLRPRRAGVYAGERLASSLCRGNWLYFPAIMWRTSWLKQYQFDTRYVIMQDATVELQMIIDGATLALDTAQTFEYRRFDGSVSSVETKSQGVRFDEEAVCYAEFADKFRAHGWTRAARAARWRVTSRLHHLFAGSRR